MSTNKLYSKIVFIIFIVIFLSLLSSFSRQILIHIRISRHLAQKQEELKTLERKNQELKKKLQQAKDPLYLREQVRLLFGLGGEIKEVVDSASTVVTETTESKEPTLSNLSKWWELFVY